MRITPLLLTLILAVFSMSATAHETLEKYCKNEQAINKTYSAEDAFILLERLQYIGNTSEFTKSEWKIFVASLKALEIGMSELEVTVQRKCDVFAIQKFEMDKNLLPYTGHGFALFDISITGWSRALITDSVKGIVHPKAAADKSITISGMVITSPNCENVVNCGAGVLGFYTEGVVTTNMITYEVGGMSTAGGGSKTDNMMDPNQTQWDYGNLEIVMPGFNEELVEQWAKVPYRDNIINIDKSTNDNSYTFEFKK